MHIGRIISAGLVGLFFLVFVAVDLVLFGIVRADSVIVTILMAVGLFGGGLLGWLAGRHADQVAERRPAPAGE